MLIGRLAVDGRYRGKGLGAALMVDAVAFVTYPVRLFLPMAEVARRLAESGR